MIYLDTHVVVWLYAGEVERLSKNVCELIEANEVFISPMVMLELQYLKEINRITSEPALMCENLAGAIGMKICDKSLLQLVTEAMPVSWTRDPFDRMIVAAAQISNTPLLTKDQLILDNYSGAVW
jgi:PIN domain nuclease of toxin-antitoxin system